MTEQPEIETTAHLDGISVEQRGDPSAGQADGAPANLINGAGAEVAFDGRSLPGPYPVGDYAGALRTRLRSFARVQLLGELVNLTMSRARVYFELRDANGAIPCAVWMDEWERICKRTGAVAEGMQVIVEGGCDYYVGSAASSPAFSFSVAGMRIAGEGDLLARIERLRKALDAEGLLACQKRLSLPALPRTIGVVCSRSGKAGQDIRAALVRRGFGGTIVWAYAPVQDRHASTAITAALQDLAAIPEVEIAIVARGGGSLADLLCFSDETLCRTVALLRIPVIASVGHHTDRTLLDEVAALSCSTPTHAAEAVLPVDLRAAREQLAGAAERLRSQSRRAILGRARALSTLCRAPEEHIRRQRAGMHQQLREMRAAARRRMSAEHAATMRALAILVGRTRGARNDCERKAPAELRRLALALDAHDPERTLRRGYALVQNSKDEPVTSAAAARKARAVLLRFADSTVEADVRTDR